MAYTNIRLCYIYGKLNKPKKAIEHGERALAIAKAIPYLKAQRMAHGSMSIAYSQPKILQKSYTITAESKL